MTFSDPRGPGRLRPALWVRSLAMLVRASCGGIWSSSVLGQEEQLLGDPGQLGGFLPTLPRRDSVYGMGA